MPDFGAISSAIVARYDAAAVTPPAGFTVNVRLSTDDPPGQLGTLPAVVVFPDEGTFRSGNGTRLGGHDFIVRFYFAESVDLAREIASVRSWLTVLVDQLRGAAMLGGLVVEAKVTSWKIGLLPYAGKTYSGAELGVHVVTSEPWTVTA